MGTLDYMAPEQAECAAAVDYRADLYALGATLFRLLVGRPPLAASPDLSPLAKLKLLASHTSPRADTLRPDLPKELANFIALLLHRDPARRPASAAHVAEKLEEFTAGNDLAALAHRAEQTQPHTPPDEPPANTAKRGTPTATNAYGGGTRRWGTTIALAGFSAFLLATIWLIVETQKGQLVIESEAENVTVKLLSDGKQYDSVKVQQGATATKLFAGKYEIEIAGASDDLLIDRESVIIRRGETVLAKIGRPQSTISLPAESSQITTEPVFEGKPLSVWLNQVETERSPIQLYSALEAVENLIAPSNAEQVRTSLLSTMATVADQPVRSDDVISSLDTQIMKIIHDSFADPTRFWASMTVVLNSSDNALAQRLYPALSRYASTPATPLVRYLAEDYFPTATDEEFILAAANFARGYLLKHSETPSDLSQQLATTLFANKSLGFDFWLEFLPPKNFFGYNQVMQQKAIEVLAMEPSSTTDALLTQATIILTELEKQSNPARIALTERDQQRVLKALAKHLKRLSQQPSEIVKLCDLNSGFADYSLPQQFMLPFFQYVRAPQTVIRRQTRNNGSLALELLELTSTFGQHADSDAAVEAMLASTRSQTIRAASKLHLDKSEFLPQVRPIGVTIVWPELDVDFYTRPGPTRSLVRPSEFQTPDKQDMLAYMIHAAAYLALSDAAQERAKREFIIEFARIITEDFLATGDQNGDAMLSEIESPLSEAEFQKADIDNDGQLSRDEIRVLVEASILDSIDGQQAQQSKIEPRFRYFAQRIITESDKNGNGVLERDEVKDNAGISAAADANNDGKLTLEELAAWLQASEQSR
jgi:Ca2+-binding EF-hand superfamily protein